jgi:hypothetical protein
MWLPKNMATEVGINKGARRNDLAFNSHEFTPLNQGNNASSLAVLDLKHWRTNQWLYKLFEAPRPAKLKPQNLKALTNRSKPQQVQFDKMAYNIEPVVQAENQLILDMGHSK